MTRLLAKLLKKVFGGPAKEMIRVRTVDLANSPLDPSLHFRLGQQCLESNRVNLANAELRTAHFLGTDSERVKPLLSQLQSRFPPLAELDHNSYFRCKVLADEISRLSCGDSLSVLDVGGGDGVLARFLADSPYVLAEPTVNGISGTSLPFHDDSFDIVCACHVLEHISIGDREGFLDQLVSKARKAVILLNPFDVPGTHVTERLRLYISICDAEWAKEHLEFTLPQVDFIKEYAARRELRCHIHPSGSLTTSSALVFASHFARMAGCGSEMDAINRFYNERYCNIVDSERFPNAYLITFAL